MKRKMTAYEWQVRGNLSICEDFILEGREHSDICGCPHCQSIENWKSLSRFQKICSYIKYKIVRI